MGIYDCGGPLFAVRILALPVSDRTISTSLSLGKTHFVSMQLFHQRERQSLHGCIDENETRPKAPSMNPCSSLLLCDVKQTSYYSITFSCKKKGMSESTSSSRTSSRSSSPDRRSEDGGDCRPGDDQYPQRSARLIPSAPRRAPLIPAVAAMPEPIGRPALEKSSLDVSMGFIQS